MDAIQVVFLALIQGLTEFLPISSSAHLILPAQLLDWPDQGLAFDVAVHFGSLFAVLIYFRKDIIELLGAWLAHVFKKEQSDKARLAWFVLWATFPAVFAGLAVNMFFEDELRQTWVIASATIFFGLILLWADRYSGAHSLNTMNFKQAMIIGFAQALALIPGTSRSGITMSAALFLGFERVAAAKFSFYLSIPIILAATSLKTLELAESPNLVDWEVIGYGVLISAISAFACIHLFLEWINKIGFLPFVIYRIALGLVLFALIFTN